ncbi:MAG: ABC transporter ATP-binding protein [Anaerolineae bacterium]|jgi:putative ABC transport system ATP-binding protein|nr:ABC transporter ATP-binding protein [Anaerolineae bacterium]
MAVIEAIQITKALHLGKNIIHALRGVDLTIERGEMVSIIGPSGSGKSTLLGILGGLDKPTTGKIAIDGVDITRMNEDQLTELRNEKIGFIFQFFNLIPTLTALENVALPMQFARKRIPNPNKRAKELLAMFGLSDRLGHRPFELSGGQQQRVAIARALANNPPILLADEPTGNLDQESGAVVIEALQNIQQQANTTVIIVTHDTELSRHAKRVVHLVDGQIQQNSIPTST